MSKISTKNVLNDLNVLVVDDNAFMRRLTRTMLMALGARSVKEESDGLVALEVIREWDPDVVFLEWDLPSLGGMELMRIVRSPGVFPRPDIPIIMLTDSAHRSAVRKALRAGVHEYLVKPISAKALRDRLMSVVIKPRPMIQLGDDYVPAPRHM
jgi:two-component system chemotaxis response regulator CheY